MEKKEENQVYNYIDSGNISHSVEIKEDDFSLVQVDKSIHDTKFKSKPTTFFKDALKRFSKNKASVAGAVILGILLLGSIIVPLADTNDINHARGDEQFLPPKLFPFGTGFWDGSVSYKEQVADPATLDNEYFPNKMLPGKYEELGTTIEFNPLYISNLSEPKEVITNAPTKFGEGGTLIYAGRKLVNKTSISDEEYLDQHIVRYYSPTHAFNLEDGYTFSVDVQDDFDFEKNGRIPGEYRLSLAYGPERKDKKSVLRDKTLVLTDFTTGDINVNLNEVISSLKEEDKPKAEELTDAALVLELKPSYEDRTVVPISSIETRTLGQVAPLSITNPCKSLAASANESLSYWTLYSVGNVGEVLLEGAKCYQISFTYDAYSGVYGLKAGQLFGESELSKYISKGQLPADLFENPDDYLGIDLYTTPINGVLYDKTPVRFVDDIQYKQSKPSDPLITLLDCRVQQYKIKGYDKAPIFIFGTDKQGHDVFKKVFVGLRTSLLLGILSAGICFVFGLCYGAIAGYFGGAVDLVMQRFTDILSGVPWIVIMTLMIIKFGATFWVFAAALCLTGWIGTAGLTRTQFYRFRGREYILASRTLGANDGRLIFRHILPNAMGTIITSSVLMVPSVIFSEATISYLGLGLKNMNSLGVILSDNQAFLQFYPYLLIVPAVVIALIMISFNLFGNGLRDAFNPSLKGSE